MKKNIFLSAIVALVIGSAMTACSDFLEAENKTAGGKTADDYFGNDASSLLVTTYNSLKSIAYNPSLFCEGTDLYINTRGKSTGVFNEYSLSAGDGTVSSFYSNTYKTINYANGVISYAGATTDAAYEARFLRAYSYYLLTQQFGSVPYVTNYINDATTSYPRTDLATIYTSLIQDLEDLYANSSLKDQSHDGHASKQAVAALLSKVYLAAGWDLQTTATDIAKGTYSVNSTDYFTQAAIWAEKAINNVSLTMSFESKWAPNNEGNAEEIFSVQYERANYPGDVSDGGHSMQNNFGGNYDDCTTKGMKNVSSEDACSEKSMYLFEKGDQRYEGTFMTTFYNAGYVQGSTTQAAWGTAGYYAYYNVSDRSNLAIAHRYFPYYVTTTEAEAEFKEHQSQYAKGNNISEVTAAVLTLPKVTVYTFNADGTVKSKEQQSISDYNMKVYNGVCVKKFDDAASEQLKSSNDYRDIVLLHVSDIYLIAAEAYYMAGQTAQALTKVNAVRQRAGLPALASMSAYQPEYTTSTSFTINDLDLILDERARELYAEGHRWMDLRRTKQLVRYNLEFNPSISSTSKMQGVDGQYKLYRPIPENEISTNTAISSADQNPGY